MTVKEKLLAGLSIGGPDVCWEWHGAHSEGYGVIWDGENKRNVLVHRAMLDLVGRGDPAMHTDHLCRNRGCANPRHLEVVTLVENVMRGDSPTAQNARKTHCKRGHEFTPENTYIPPSGKRYCLTCKRAADEGRPR